MFKKIVLMERSTGMPAEFGYNNKITVEYRFFGILLYRKEMYKAE